VSVVSVIIPSYNAARWVGNAIESVLNQTMSDFEVIVVDDGSSDDTGATVAKYLSDRRVRYISCENRGPSSAKNTGAKASCGDYLTFLDADDSLESCALELMLRTLHLTGAAWLNVGVLKKEGETNTFRHPFVPQGDLLLAILDDDFITRSPFYPRQEFFTIGMYDEEFIIREDWDLNIRMICAHRQFAVLDEPLYHYARTEGSLMTGSRRKVLFYTEKLLCKHHKCLADSGHGEAAKLYAKNMWDLSRFYFYQIRDLRNGMKCALESLRYDPSPSRLVHPLFHRLQKAFI
jgi:glycosyltransferase involved in cell wall biosynthesis